MLKLENMTEPELGIVMKAVAMCIETVFNQMGIEKPMFAALVFNDPKVTQYICNCHRQDVIKAMRECADRLEGRETLERSEFGD